MQSQNQSLAKLVIDKIKKNDLKQIFQILMIIPQNRTIADINRLTKIIINIQPIKQIKNFSAIYHCCKNMYLAKFKQKDFIFQKKQDSQSLYIILNGKIGLYKRSNDQYQSQQVIFLQQGSCFGKLFNWKIRFLPLALEQTLIAILPKRQFNKISIVVNIQKQMILKQVKNSGLITSQIDQEKLKSISHTFVYNRIPHGHYLIKDGEIPKVIFLILKGMVKKVIQIGPKSLSKQQQNNSDNNIKENNTTTDIKNIKLSLNFNCQDMYSVNHYSAGDYFPKQNLNSPTNYSLITQCASQIITIPKKALKSIGYQFIYDKINQGKNNQYYREELSKQNQWKKYKENIISDVINTNKEKKVIRQLFK